MATFNDGPDGKSGDRIDLKELRQGDGEGVVQLPYFVPMAMAAALDAFGELQEARELAESGTWLDSWV